MREQGVGKWCETHGCYDGCWRSSAKPQPAQAEEPSLGELVCFDCKEPYAVPFDNGDGEVRCAACAVDKYMKLPGATVVLTEKVFKICGS